MSRQHISVVTDAIIDELGQLVAALKSTTGSEWSRPTPCAGWTVANLAEHVAGSIPTLNEGIRRMLEGDSEPGSLARPELPGRDEIIAALEAGRDESAALLAGLRDDQLDRGVPLSFGTLPLGSALQVMTFEYGAHRYDVACALGEDKSLSSAVAHAAAAIVPMLPDEPAATPLGYVLNGETLRLAFRCDDTGWAEGWNSMAPTCTVTGTDSAVMLFATGRLPADSPLLSVSGECGAAADFKHYFPGP